MEFIDLHCDLLAYLALSPERTPLDQRSRCSVPQLNEGRVKTQVLAISAETGIYSLLMGLQQIKCFLDVQETYPGRFLPAFENASAFSLESEPLDTVFKRLENILKEIHPTYISLTWNGENRFGGGCGAKCGLKGDGRELLRYLNGKGIAIDFSHTSDSLAYDLFDFIDKERLDILVMASHSNFREVVENIRNLPDDIAKELIKRKGLIGMVFYTSFLESPDNLISMIEHGLKLGGEEALAFGADYFCLDDLFSLLHHGGGFFDEMADSSCYPKVIESISELFDKELLSSIACKNALDFLLRSQPSLST